MRRKAPAMKFQSDGHPIPNQYGMRWVSPQKPNARTATGMKCPMCEEKILLGRLVVVDCDGDISHKKCYDAWWPAEMMARDMTVMGYSIRR